MDNPKIRAKLQGSAILPSGRRLVNPLLIENGNLCGIISILHKEYSKPDLVVFCNMLLQMLSLSVSADDIATNPGCGINLVLNEMTAWDQMDLFQFMTRDHFYTVMALNTYPAGSYLRRTAIARLLDFIDRKNTDNSWENETDTMPLFHQLEHFIKDVHTHGNNMKGNNQVYNRRSQNKQSHGNTPREGEKAMAATATPPTPGTPTGSSGYPSIFDTATIADGVYNTEVTRDRQPPLYTVNTNDGRKHMYTATKKICLLCFPDGKPPEKGSKAPATAHKPRCSSRLCTTCHLYGHTPPICHQSVRQRQEVDGKLSEIL